MKTIIITIKTDQLHENKNTLVYANNVNYLETNSSYTELKAKDCITTQHIDNNTVFGSSMKDEFMYHLAISG